MLLLIQAIRRYVANSASNTVSAIDTSTNKVVATIPVGGGPWGVAFDSSHSRVYVANSAPNTVSVIVTAQSLSNTTITSAIDRNGNPI